MNRSILFLLFLLAATSAGAQTKRIAHRSHGGSDAAFDPQRQSRDDLGIIVDQEEMRHRRQVRDSLAAARVVADSAAAVQQAPVQKGQQPTHPNYPERSQHPNH